MCCLRRKTQRVTRAAGDGVSYADLGALSRGDRHRWFIKQPERIFREPLWEKPVRPAQRTRNSALIRFYERATSEFTMTMLRRTCSRALWTLGRIVTCHIMYITVRCIVTYERIHRNRFVDEHCMIRKYQLENKTTSSRRNIVVINLSYCNYA